MLHTRKWLKYWKNCQSLTGGCSYFLRKWLSYTLKSPFWNISIILIIHEHADSGITLVLCIWPFMPVRMMIFKFSYTYQIGYTISSKLIYTYKTEGCKGKTDGRKYVRLIMIEDRHSNFNIPEKSIYFFWQRNDTILCKDNDIF